MQPAFGQQRRADRLTAASDHTALLLGRFGLHKPVQLFQAAYLRHGHKMVPPVLATYPFDAALFMAFANRRL